MQQPCVHRCRLNVARSAHCRMAHGSRIQQDASSSVIRQGSMRSRPRPSDAHHSRAGSIKATVVGLVDSSCILGPHRQHGCPCKTHQA
ncbi:hypothetical protein BC831DRAFT_553029 [Entophlyctis helioformis]|nr:hypothetical protein BC831DRAFT_553029 [Entophlyctis helioformis]